MTDRIADMAFTPPPECPDCFGLGYDLELDGPDGNDRLDGPTACRTCDGTGLA